MNTRELKLDLIQKIIKIDDVSFIPLLYNVYQNDSNEEIRDSAYRTLDELSIALHYHSIDQMVLDYIEKEKKK